MTSFFAVFRDNAKVAWGLVGALVLLLLVSTALLASTAEVRFKRDISRIAFNGNWELLEDIKKRVGVVNDSLERALEASPEAPEHQPYIVVSIEERRLWYKQGGQTLFTTQVATGSGKTLVKESGHDVWKFETPRGRLLVQRKEVDPVWVPPDWHYIELARKRGLGVLRLNRGESIAAPDGSELTTVGNDVVRRYPDGRIAALEAGEGREIVVGGNVIIPPYGTNQRKYTGVLGSHRLYLGDGYGLHGTDKPQTIGQAVSHGCVRLRNEDIAYLYSAVPVGTPVYIY